MIAWQRPTLAERKSATIGAKQLSLLVNGGHYLSQLHSFLTHLPRVSSLRLSLVSSILISFTSNSFFGRS